MSEEKTLEEYANVGADGSGEWEIRSLGDLAEYQNGNAFSRSDWGDAGYPIIRIQNLTGEQDDYNYYDGDLEDRYRVKPGDTLLSWSATINVFRWDGPEAALNQHIFRVDSSPDVNDVFYRFKLEHLLPYLEALSHGSTMKHVRKVDLVNLRTEIPPLEVQREIATVLNDVEQAIEKLQSIQDQSERVKQGIAQDLFHSGIDHKATTDTWAGEIPDSWDIVPFSDIIESTRNGIYKSEDAYGSGNPIAKMGNALEELILDMSSHDRLELTEDEKEKYGLREGDLIFARRAQEVSAAGDCTLVPDLDELTVFESSLIRVRLKDTALPEFYMQYFDGPVGSRAIKRIVTETSISGVATSDLVNLDVPVPSLEEQKRIASALSSFDDHVWAIERELEQLQRLKRDLMQDLLSGEVRTTDADIEVLDEVLAHG